MKYTSSIILNLASLLVVLIAFDAGHTLTLFLLAGVVPGTNITIAPVDMLAAIATIFTVLILRIGLWQSIRPLFFGEPAVLKHSTRRQNHSA